METFDKALLIRHLLKLTLLKMTLRASGAKVLERHFNVFNTFFKVIILSKMQ